MCKRNADQEFTTETLPPLWAVPSNLNWHYNYFIKLKLKRFPIIVISHLADKELLYKSYLSDVTVSLLFIVKCHCNYLPWLFAAYKVSSLRAQPSLRLLSKSYTLSQNKRRRWFRAPPPIFAKWLPNGSGMGVRKNFKLLKYEHIINHFKACDLEILLI